MKIIQPSVEIVNPIDYKTMLNTVELAIRNCYQSQDKIEEGSAEKIIKNCLSWNHFSVLEFADITVKFVTDRACYDDKTEILTKDGWKFFSELKEEDAVATLNQETKKVEFKKPLEYISYFYNGKMVKIKTKNTDLLVTPNHNIWAKKTDLRTKEFFSFHRADTLKNKYILDKTFDYDTNFCENEVVIPGFSYSYQASSWNNKKYLRTDIVPDAIFNKSDFVKFLAFYLSEGTTTKCGIEAYRISISQKKCEKNKFTRELIKNTLTNMGIKSTEGKKDISFKHKQLGKFLSKLGTAIHKFFPFNVFDFFNKHYAKLFIDTYLLFDGHKDEYCYGKLYTSSNRLKNDLECISIIAGLSFHTFVRNLVGKQIVICGNKANVNAPNYTINLTNKYNKNPYIQVKNSVSETSYTGYVYCVNVDNHIIYVKRNGVAVWCGNCLSQLSRQRLLSLAVQSQRYCNYAKDRFGRDISFIEPYGLRTDVAKEAWIFSMKEAEAQYFNLIENHKLPAEVARSVLPNSTATTIYAKTNVREWRHIFNLRCDTHAQQDIRWLMTDALTQMFNLYPVFFEDLYIKFVKEAY